MNSDLRPPSFIVTQDERFMQRAMELAQLGSGQVSPNPLVGCVIVHGGQIIGEGWHQKFGGPHAEVNAVNSVKDQSVLPDSTVYVNLEPCSHHGKTPPCADLLIEKKVARVVIANVDTNPLVAGAGITKLRKAGVEVTTEVLAPLGRELNKRFFTLIEAKRPYVILKWAETKDGFIAQSTGESKWISHIDARQLVHRWRSEEDAVLVGTRTAALDNPQLNVRDWSGRNPLRVVIDRSLKLNPSLKLFDGTQSTICYNLAKDEERRNLRFVKLAGKDFLTEMLADLHRLRVQSLLVEGGTETLKAFINTGRWDEARVFRSSKSFGEGIPSAELKGDLVSETQLLEDNLLIYKAAKT